MPETDRLAEFPRGVSALAALLADGAARVLFGFYGGTRIELLESHPGFASILERSGLDAEALETIAGEAANILYAVLNDVSREEFVRYALRSVGDDAREAEREEEGARFDAVAQGLATPELAARQWLKRTAHQSVVSSVSWDVWTKCEGSEGEPPNGPVDGASLTLSTNSSLGEIDDPEQRVTIVMDEEDIDHLVDVLTRLKAALVSVPSRSRR